MSYNPDDEDFKFLAIDKKKLMAEAPPYDGQKSVFVPCPKEGYIRGEITGTKGDDVMVKTAKGEDKTYKKDVCQPRNPPKFEKMEDMANMSYLSESAVLHNLRERYQSTLIYTYSGLFCIAVNPYKRLPIYGMNVVRKYKGKKKNEVPPHLFSIADNAYSNMLQDRENQSCLITGESGAGKTENTKKVISYFALVAACGQSAAEKAEDDGKGSLEDQIVQCNPVLEAYGNAKTTRNNNSSRFGKFIRIHFGPTGKIAGCDIETYLLEKSRVTYQQPGIERNYHVFYQLLCGHIPDLADKLLAEPDASKYHFINQGCLTVDNMDDGEELDLMEQAYKTLGFADEDKMAFYKITMSILHLGEMKFKQKGREEQADADGTAEAEKAAALLGISPKDLLDSILRPKVKVGNEMVTKGQNLAQVAFGIQALSKSLFNRMFNEIVLRVNKTLDTKNKRQFFIGVLDIAGFEIFDYNTFEQLCINYTNERLQQFFNHHMFVLEQEEYKKEAINWVFIDFGMDLAACIELIEKPQGILSILEEQCMFPKATDKTLIDALNDKHLGKSKCYAKPKPSKAEFPPHFELAHYAGNVGYNIAGWLDKNKDPVNDTVVATMQASKAAMVSLLFQPPPEPAGAAGGGQKKKKKGAAFQTISVAHKESLGKLMHTLYSTHPHFVRCLIPNEMKTPGLVDAALVMHQLQCNGVLEGIRICRKGFPNRMPYGEFNQRYFILAADAAGGISDQKAKAEKILEKLNLEENDFRTGNTKVFFRAGVLGVLEDIRDAKLSVIISSLQAYIRAYIMQKSYKKLQAQRQALVVIQSNVRGYFGLKNWQWFKLFTRLKPLLADQRSEEELQENLNKLKELKEKNDKTAALHKAMEDQNASLQKEAEEMKVKIKELRGDNDKFDEMFESLSEEKIELEEALQEFEADLKKAEAAGGGLEGQKKALEQELGKLKDDQSDMDLNLKKASDDLKSKEHQIETLNGEMAKQDEVIARLTKDKKSGDEGMTKALADLSAAEDSVNHLTKLKEKMEGQIEDLEDGLEREKKARSEAEKARRKLESEVKQTQETVDDLERIKKDLEDQMRRKDNELVNLNTKLEDQAGVVAGLQKRIKELQARIAELEEELAAEKAAYSKADKARMDLSAELDELSEKLDEAGGANQAALDLNKKRETELSKMRRDMEEMAIQSEATIASLKKKQNDAQNDLTEQLDSLSKAKSKIEKERNQLKSEVNDLQSQVEMVQKGQANAQKISKNLEAQLSEVNAKLDECTRNITDANQAKGRVLSENADVARQLEEAEAAVQKLNKEKFFLTKTLEEAKVNLDEETRIRQKLQSDHRALQNEVDGLRDALEEEQEGHADAQRLLTKATAELNEWKRKGESGEGSVAGAEFDELKRKMNSKIADVEAALEAALSKAGSCEKQRNRLQMELEDVTLELERCSSVANAAEKKQRAFDKTVADWKHKVADMQHELEISANEGRGHANEVFRLRALVDESHDTVEALRRDNKALADEISDLTGQLSDGGRSVHELEKSRKRLEMEKEELQAALEEAEGALENEEAKVMRATLEVTGIRQEIDKRLAEKDEEFETTRKNHARALDSIQASLEAEVRGKSEALKMKKKLEHDINELETALDAANRGRSEAEKNIKKYQIQIREIQVVVEEEAHARMEAREAFTSAERRSAVLAGEIEEIRSSLEVAERARKCAEGELHEAADRVSELSTATTSLSAIKRKLEADVSAMQTDLEDQAAELRIADENSKKAMSDASSLATELRSEQEHYGHIEKMRRALESQMKEAQIRLDEAEASSMKGGKRMIQKLEQRVRELEVELDNEQRRHADSAKGLRKQDRRLKELAFQSDEDRKNQDRLQALIDGLQGKIKSFKHQAEEAEEIAAINLSKYRKVQHDLEEAEERADMAENTLTKLRMKNRSLSREPAN